MTMIDLQQRPSRLPFVAVSRLLRCQVFQLVVVRTKPWSSFTDDGLSLVRTDRCSGMAENETLRRPRPRDLTCIYGRTHLVRPPCSYSPRGQACGRFAIDDCLDELPTRRHCAAVLGRVQVLRSASPLRAPSATWTRPARGSRVALVVGSLKISKNDKSETSRRDLSSGATAVGAVSKRSRELHTKLRRRPRRSSKCARKLLKAHLAPFDRPRNGSSHSKEWT